jgi:hypothetical protein
MPAADALTATLQRCHAIAPDAAEMPIRQRPIRSRAVLRHVNEATEGEFMMTFDSRSACAPQQQMADSLSATSIPHGGHCECEHLAAALGCKPSAISFEFCQRVLKRHWRLNCRHGSCDESPAASIARRWTSMGPADSVKAILVSNAPEEE